MHPSQPILCAPQCPHCCLPLQTPMTLFFGLTGVVIFLGIGPLLLVLWLAGVGLGSLSWQTFGVVVAKGLLDNVLSDYLWARAILLVGACAHACMHSLLRALPPAGGACRAAGSEGPPVCWEPRAGRAAFSGTAPYQRRTAALPPLQAPQWRPPGCPCKCPSRWGWTCSSATPPG